MRNSIRPSAIQRVVVRQQLSAKQIKVMLVIGAVLLSSTVVLYTQFLVNQLRMKEERTITLYANILRYYASESTGLEDMSFFLEYITPTINFPMILTTSDDEPMYPYDGNVKNIDLPAGMGKDQQRALLKAYMQEMAQTYEPILLRDARNNVVISKIYYTNSDTVRQLMFFPYIEIFVVAMFIFLGYIAFNYLRASEQSGVWVGLAKEAAHQLGTPLSSMLAWLEILKLEAENPAQVCDVADQMQHDVDRLNKIAHRFSKIGSKPEMRAEDVSLIIQHVVRYFELRLPHLGKLVKIKCNIQHNIMLTINAELFEWVIENLVKNAAEAMESSGGAIDILLERQQSKTVILVCDTGKGMTQKVKREVFKPGFSTKKRGWGLGLSLCKRIIEDYHGGKIYVKDTAPGKGTVFAIEFPNEEQSRLQAEHTSLTASAALNGTSKPLANLIQQPTAQ
jgi:signal transduction histidine kinase